MKEVNMEVVFKILREFVEKFEVPSVNKIGLEEANVFKVLIATILSARSKDEVTNKVSNKLFSKAKNFEDLRNLKLEEVIELIKPIRFYNNKAKNLKKLGEVMVEYKDKIPDSIDALVKLPGVGRKTANLVLVAGFGKLSITVDVHVNRIFNRIGYVKTKNPYETEMALRKKLPKEYWLDMNRVFVAFGQNLCRPISPHCSKCPIIKYCKRIDVRKSR